MKRTNLGAATGFSLFTVSSLAALLFSAGCAPKDEASRKDTTTQPKASAPADLSFKKIEQQVNQPEQQTGRYCPGSFKAQIQSYGEVEILDADGNTLISGQLPESDVAELATTANEVVSEGTVTTSSCDNTAPPAGAPPVAVPPWSQHGTAGLYITTKTDQTNLVAAAKGSQNCDYSKGGKGKDLQQQVGKAVKQACDGALPPGKTYTPPVTPGNPSIPDNQGTPAYPGQPNYPGQPAYPGQPNYPGQPAYPGQPNYPGQPANPPGQPANPPGQPAYPPGQPAYPGQPNYPGQPANPGNPDIPDNQGDPGNPH